jgi:peptidoglycan hydrolase CwlO-like protein
MKKTIVLLIAMMFVLSSTMAFASKNDKTADPDKPAVPVKTENKLSDEEVNRIKERVEEIRKMDKSDLTSEETDELKSEMKELKQEVKKSSGPIYIGGASLILIIILVILLV